MRKIPRFNERKILGVIAKCNQTPSLGCHLFVNYGAFGDFAMFSKK